MSNPTANDLMDALTYDQAAALLHAAAGALEATARALRASGQGVGWERALARAASDLSEALAELASVHAPEPELAEV